MRPANEVRVVPAQFPFVWIIVVVVTLGFLLEYVNQLNTVYRYTYLEPSNRPGSLRSDRLSPIWWTEVIVGVTRFSFILSTLARLLYHWEPGIVNVHYMVCLVHLVSEVCNSVLLGLEWENCNTSEEFNRCSSYKWCGLYGANSTSCPKNYCPENGNVSTVYVWDPPVSSVEDLGGHNLEYDIAFGVSLVMCLCSFLTAVLCYLSRRSSRSAVALSSSAYYVHSKQPQHPKEGEGRWDGKTGHELEMEVFRTSLEDDDVVNKYL
jgi:hypothetical protein